MKVAFVQRTPAGAGSARAAGQQLIEPAPLEVPEHTADLSSAPAVVVNWLSNQAMVAVMPVARLPVTTTAPCGNERRTRARQDSMS